MRRKLAILAAALVAALVLVPNPASATVITLHCGFAQVRQVDPIVAPGIEPSAHLHSFYGVRGVTSTSTPDALRGGSTTCSATGDTGAMWAPTAYLNLNGLTTSTHVGEYWRCSTHCAAPPAGMEYATPKTYVIGPGDHVGWHCTNGPSRPSPVGLVCTGGQKLKYQVDFPNCYDGAAPGWDGAIAPVHFIYAPCPPGWQLIATLSLQVDLPVTSIAGVTFSSGDWTTAHADFLNSWNQAALVKVLAPLA